MRPAGAPSSPKSKPLPSILGWVLVACLISYTTCVHQGLAPAPGGMPTDWWHPSGFLRDRTWVASWVGRPLTGVFMLSLPAAIAACLLFITSRSSSGRAIAASSVVTVAVMSFYGLSRALRVWEFFHWRGSVVIVCTGVVVGCTLAAPWLAERWLKLRPPWKIISYLPVFFAVVSIMRSATGTDENLFFNISPWPAIPVLGLEIACYSLVGLMIGLALGVAAFTGTGPRPALRIAGFVGGAIFPVLWFAYRFSQTKPIVLFAMLFVSVLALAAALATRGPEGRSERRRRAINFATGAALVTLPLFSGHALANRDYDVTRHVRAEALIEALSRYYADEYEYPEDLADLIAGGYLEKIPKPRIGFELYYQLGWLEPIEFEYRNLGSSYVLEFISTEWVMCAYNPPWLDDDGEEDSEDPETGEAWSCPDTRPELW